MLARLKVILTAAVTYITIAQFVLIVLADEIAKVFPDGSETVVDWVIKVGAVLAGVVNIIRRVTPVLASERGILPNQ